jgi:hypothetical protein
VAEFSRKKLKQDRFAQVVGQEVALFQKHRTAITIAAVVIVAAILGGYSYQAYRERVADEASTQFLAAVRLYHGVVTTEQRPGFITFTTSGERQRRCTEAFEQVIKDYSGRDEAVGARYYLGLLDLEQGKFPEGEEKLKEAMNDGGPYGALARLSLADALADQGKADDARKEYQYLIEHPTPIVPKERAQLQLARMLADTDPAAAKPILEELMAQPGPVSVSAGTTLRQIQGG